jgi:hypothetical protein
LSCLKRREQRRGAVHPAQRLLAWLSFGHRRRPYRSLGRAEGSCAQPHQGRVNERPLRIQIS